VYRLSVSLPNFSLEKYEKAVAGIGETEGERAQKYRIGQNIFRDDLMEYWNGRCPLSGELLIAYAKGEISYTFLKHRYPFLASELARQGLKNGLATIFKV
jgi:hypothetical protein